MRKSGILMHISSLPGPYGIGSMGKGAYEFVDFLAEAGQAYWQVLPLCPTGYGDSPYQSFSTFAGNHYLIDLDMLISEGLLKQEEVDVAMAKAYLGLNEEEGPVWGVIRGCMGSVSKLCVVQMQDYLELGGEARMNFPGTLYSNNWTWRSERGFITEELTRRIRETTRRYGRL